MPLENPSESPCFGCGPLHARGLHLQFERVKLDDGRDAVEVRHTPLADEVGWAGLFHTGLHFTVLFEASYWAALELTGRVHVARGAQTFDQRRLPRVGAPFVARAWIESREPLVTRAQSATLEGKPLATLDTPWLAVTRAHVEKWRVELPQYLLDEIPDQ